jgi:hypothetical protein
MKNANKHLSGKKFVIFVVNIQLYNSFYSRNFINRPQEKQR